MFSSSVNPSSDPPKKDASVNKEAPKKRGRPRKNKVQEPKDSGAKVEKGKGKDKKSEVLKDEEPKTKLDLKLYTLKFNSPILPFAKFPLTQNKYIQDFLRKYEEDHDKITKVIGVHFQNNSNSNAVGTVGIEIEISKRNNITIVESNSNKRFKVKAYDEASNFCTAEEYSDETMMPNNVVEPKYKDLLMSELFELKNLWFFYNKKINSLLTILPQEILNRYDMVSKTLQPPVFDIARYPVEHNFVETFNEIVYKMA